MTAYKESVFESRIDRGPVVLDSIITSKVRFIIPSRSIGVQKLKRREQKKQFKGSRKIV